MSDIMGENVIKRGRELEIPESTLVFDLDAHPHKISLLEEYRGKSGWLWLDKLTIKSFEEIDTLIFTLCDAEGNILKPEMGEKLFAVPATPKQEFKPCPYQTAIDEHKTAAVDGLRKDSEQNNHRYFSEELDKLDRWAEDLKTGLELELKQLDRDIKDTDRQSKQLISLQEKLEFQKKKAAMEKRRNQKRHELFTAQDQVDRRREELIEQLEKQLKMHSHEVTSVFHIQWRIA
jgi:adenine-specific DNA-methyltransferase